jgi:4a-hydroxytetrahydrobiopterin dehydratase
MSQKLTDAQIEKEISRFPGWSSKGDAIQKSFKLDDHIVAIGFINRIAMVAEVMNHHPEIRMVYNKVDITLSTHDAGGVTKLDLELAQKIDKYF